MGESDFTIKEIVLKIDSKLDRFIEKAEEHNDICDGKIEGLERHRDTTIGVIKTIAWIITSSGALTGLFYIIKHFV